MSDLATAVAEKLTKESLGREDVEQVLRAARVTLSAAAPTPVRLRVARVEFRGTKRFEDGAAVAEASAGASITAGKYCFRCERSWLDS